MSKSAAVAGRIQCVACGRIRKVSVEQLERRIRCTCGNVTRASERDLITSGGSANFRRTRVRPASSPDSSSEAISEDDIALVQVLRDSCTDIKQQLGGVIVGQEHVVEEVLLSIFARGHVLLVGVPGLAKTLLVSSVAEVLDLDFRRIQFTPDLMPADITGTEILQEDRTTGKRSFQFVEGPVFGNMVLADEINRAPPKTQSALLEAMQERHVTVAGNTCALPAPFLVMATQNPIEQEGTFALPEAQLDRFLFNIVVDYPDSSDEFTVIKQATSGRKPQLRRVLDAEQILKLQETVQRIPVADHVIAYARDLVTATRPGREGAPGFIKEMVSWGAGPRAGISLILAAKARAILHGRYHVTTGDVSSVALPVLRHRIVTTFHAEAAGVNCDNVIESLLQDIEPRRPQNGHHFE